MKLPELDPLDVLILYVLGACAASFVLGIYWEGV